MFEKTQFKYQRLFSDRRLGAERVLLFGEHLGDVHTVAVDADGNIVSVMKGNDDGTLRTIAVDSNARLEAVMKGLFGSTFKTLATDTNGNLIAILKGASGNDIAVDASGYLTAVMHGDTGAVAQDASNKLISIIQGSESLGIKQKASTGELISVIQGSEGIDVKQKATTGELISVIQGDKGAVAQDASNKLISVMQGSQGIDVAQQATSGELVSVMKGIEGATLRTMAVDSAGNIVAVMKGDYADSLQTIKLDAEHRMIGRMLPSVDEVVTNRADSIASGTGGSAYSSAVPTGKIWKITHLSAVNISNITNKIFLNKIVGANTYTIDIQKDIPLDNYATWDGEIWLAAGEKIEAEFFGCTDGDNLYLFYFGTQIGAV